MGSFTMSGDRQTCRINFLGRQPNKRIWQTLPVRTQKLANLAATNSKLGESCRYELKNLANLADMKSKLGESCRYEHKDGKLAGVNSRMANLPV
jgi:hypothetical protein